MVVEGHFEEKRITATLRASEPGVEANGKLVLDVPTRIATFDLQARSSSLRSLARAPDVVGGAASARARGKLDLKKGTIAATTTASADEISLAAFSANHLAASGTVAGPLSAPVVDIGFAGVDMALQVKGKSPLAYPHATGHAKIAIAPSPRIVDASIQVGASGVPEGISASAESVDLADGQVEARGLRVTGLGDPLELDVRLGNGQWSVRAKSDGVDLQRAAGVTGIKELSLLPAGTRAALDIDVRQGEAGAAGHLDVSVRTPKGALLAGEILAEAHAKIDRGKLTGTGKVAAEGFGEVEIASAELDVPGRLDAHSLERTTGTMELRGAIDLSQGAALFAGESVERVSGIASFEGRIERGDPGALPSIRVTVRTEGLEVALAGEPPTQSFLVSGVDLVSHAAWDGRTEDAEIALLAWDAHGLLGTASAKSKVPLLDWATGAKTLDGSALALLDFDAAADAPSRDLADLPAFLRVPGLRGHVDGHVRVAGTLARPRVSVSARADGLAEHMPRNGPSFEPLDGTLEARLDDGRGAITFGLDERKAPRHQRKDDGKKKPPSPHAALLPQQGRSKKEPGHLRGIVLLTDARMSDVLAGRLPAWRATAEVEVESLALAALPLPSGLTGSLSGRARIKDLNGDPSFEAKAHIANLGAGNAKVEGVDITAGGRDASLFAHAAIVDQSSKATIQIASQSLRMKGTAASWDSTAPTRVDYAVENGRLALFGPMLKRSISEIDGRVDGTGSVSIDEDGQLFEGGLAVNEATLYVNALGEEITGLSATARFDRTGTWKIEDAVGKIGTGEFRATAAGRMKGLQFVDAEATLVATKDGVPISAEGATFAEATGEMKVAAKMTDDRTALVLTVDLPRADVQLPDRGAQQLEPLEPDPTVAIGVRRRDGELDTKIDRKGRGGKLAGGANAGNEPLPIRASVTLGDQVHLEGRGLDVSLGGRTLVEIADELKVTGRIDLHGGTIEVHGRRFTVETGTVTFLDGGDPDDPTVVASAYWDAPDRTRVWVEFTGPLKTGKLTLRSEPPYSKTEILSVLLFGRPDPNMASPSAGSTKGDASGATPVASGLVAGDLNRMLSEIDENLDLETDTLSGNRTRTKLGRSFFDRRLKVQIGYAPGSTYREPDTTFLFLNWQFIPKWSLVATRGDRGTSILDVLFQHRY
jgi:translocation and assembly module TamB